ncbi:MAG TPA: serine hydrolase domain-containing protein [Methylomirabilota bacterium]|nr:serine hydrolase domain-containing protein [Methylomirabilota bacterium]
MTASQPIGGGVDPAFAAVADAFRENFARRGEIGAALCVRHRGRTAVDLWGGCRDRATGAPWREDTVVPVFSTGKGMVAATAAVAVSRGWMDYDDPVAAHWPRFGDHGKAAVTVRHLLDHSAGLVLFGRRIGRGELADRAAMIAIMEAMTPAWKPGEGWGYHLATFGELVGELLRRVDPDGRPFGRLFAEEIAGPLAAAVHFGLPDDVPDDRVARIAPPPLRLALRELVKAPRALWRKALNPASLLHRTMREISGLDTNDRGWLTLPFPSANAIATARGLAVVYGCLASGGDALGVRPEVFDALVAPSVLPSGGATDLVLGIEPRWRLGFIHPNPERPYSPSPRAFGMPGLGGSFAFADPDNELAYAYTPNRMGVLPFDDPRELSLRKAVYRAIARG